MEYHQLINTSVFLGPMSKNIVDATIEFANDNNVPIGLIPSRRQVDYKSGYVNNWNTKSFSKYVRNKSNNIIIVRDHGGENQGDTIDDGFKSFYHDSKYFDVVHIDVWKCYKEINEGVIETIKNINYCYSINPNILFEIGTEQSIREFTIDELKYLLIELKNNLDEKIFKQIKYLVIQCGTSLIMNENTGIFDENKLNKMIELSKKYNLLSKEHNGDYQSNEIVKKKFKLGLNCINIAPELGKIETECILNNMNSEKDIDWFFNLCYESKRWEKWVGKDFDPFSNKKELILISGHYVFSHNEFKNYMNNKYELNEEIKNKIKNKINSLLF